MAPTGSITLRQLRYFGAVARARSFSTAARMLNVSQPALGLQVRELEARLGVQLLARHARGVELTAVGQVFLARSEEVLETLQRAQDSVAEFRTQPGRDILLGVTPTIGRALFEELLLASGDPAGAYVVILREGLTSELLRLLRDGEAQAAFCYDPPADPLYGSWPLFEEDLVLVGRFESEGQPGDTLNIGDLPGYPLALGARQDASRQAIERCAAAHGVTLNVRVEIAPVSLKREMLIRRGLSTIVPYGLFLPEILAGQLEFRRIQPSIRRTMALAIRSDLPEAAARHVLGLARDAVAAEVERGALGWRLL